MLFFLSSNPIKRPKRQSVHMSTLSNTFLLNTNICKNYFFFKRLSNFLKHLGTVVLLNLTQTRVRRAFAGDYFQWRTNVDEIMLQRIRYLF